MCRTNVPYFAISPEKFVFSNFWGISNEWMKKPFFFISGLFFFPNKNLNEWMTQNDLLTFPWKKKQQKTPKKFWEKKKNYKQPLFKKRKLHQNLIEWPMNFSSGKKKKQLYFFFPRFAGKKKHDFRIWMNEWPTSMSAKKKNTVPLMRHIGVET